MELSPAVVLGLGLSFSLVALPRALAARRPRPAGPALPEDTEPVERRWLDLRAPLEEMSRSCGTMLRAAGIELEHRLPDLALGVCADPGELRQAFSHIVRLACDAMPSAPGGMGLTLRMPLAAAGDIHQAAPAAVNRGTLS